MSPGLSAPSNEWMSTPSHTSIAIFARYSCDRCIGLRVWNAATLDQPSAVKSARVCAGVMNSAPYLAANSPVERTLIGPAILTSPCSITTFTPGCAGSTVRNTVAHSCFLSIVYFSVTSIVASGSSPSGSIRAIWPPVRIDAAAVASAESVMGIGQNRPLAVFMPSHTPRQSACVMKPSSGVKPPMPSMMMSPFSREHTRNRGNVAARRRSAAISSAGSSRGRNSPPPCGWTNAMISCPPFA